MTEGLNRLNGGGEIRAVGLTVVGLLMAFAGLGMMATEIVPLIYGGCTAAIGALLARWGSSKLPYRS